jgi:phenylacetate-CoA ligase
MGPYFDEQETLSPQERSRRHDERLAEMCRRGCAVSPYVKAAFDDYDLTADDIRSVKDLEKLPVISRERLVSLESGNPPYGGLTAPGLITDRIFTSPGPVYEPHLSEGTLWHRGYRAAGFGEGDIVLNTFSYHMVAAGLTFHEGLRSAGATVVPSGTSSTEMQVQLIRDLKVTAYTGTPSFLMAIIAKAEEQGIDVKADTELRKACFVAEPLQPSLRIKFEEEYGIDTYQMYGATEVGDIAYECREKNGWHLCEDVIVEIVDPETGMNVEPGQWGEVVVTRLNDMFFLFRFATGDLSRLLEASCLCGRTSRRLDGIAGRVGDAVKVRGLFIAPSQLNKLQQQFEDLLFQLVVTRQDFKDHLKIIVASHDEISPEKIDRFAKSFRDICSVRPDAVEVKDMAVLKSSPGQISDRREWR